MDIAGLGMAMSTANLTNDFGVAMLSKSLDTTQDIGEGLVEMIDKAAMERSVNPSVGGNFDFTV